MQDEIMTVKEVAKYLKVKPVTVYKLCNEGKIPAFRVANRWRIKESLLKKHIFDRDYTIRFKEEMK